MALAWALVRLLGPPSISETLTFLLPLTCSPAQTRSRSEAESPSGSERAGSGQVLQRTFAHPATLVGSAASPKTSKEMI